MNKPQPNGPEPLTFYDTRAFVGRARAPVMADADAPVARLAEDLARHRIVGAAVGHAVAMEASPRIGHDLLDAELAGYEATLRPAWHLMPDVDARVERAVLDPTELLERRVALGRITMGDFCGGRGHEAGFGPVLQACNTVSLPVFLDFTQEGGHGTFRTFDFAFLGLYPRVPFVVEGFGGYPLHRLMWLLREYPHVHLSTVGFSAYRGVELICETVGAERIVFGSGWPSHPIGMSQGTVAFAEVPSAVRAQMASGNFRRMLDGIGAIV